MLKNIAVLLTCHNRKEKTISCLKSLFDFENKNNEIPNIDVYLTDDGSTDGTSELVSVLFPLVKIFYGDGTFFWAKGMRNSWIEALKHDYDAFLLLNDDTNVSKNLFEEFNNCHKYSLMKYNCSGIYIGSTHDGENNFSYGGSEIKNKILNTHKRVIPNGFIKTCDLGNANIMLINHSVVSKIGILSNEYRHGIADYDYILTARKNDIPVLLTANYCGFCTNDKPDPYIKFVKLSLVERKEFLYNPIGLAFSDQVKFMKKFYPYRLPFIFIAAWFKLLFPNAYVTINKLRK